MKPTAVVINVARGEIMDEEALAAALKEKRIGGASLDVFSREPLEQDNPLCGLQAENLILTPHIAGVTNEAKMRIISMAIHNIVTVLKGGRPENIVTT